MSMMFSCCYSDSADWAKGTLHVHTDNSPCGHYPVRTVCDLYFGRIMKYDFIAITDHMLRTPVPEWGDGKTIFPGEEFKRHDKQILGIGIGDIPDDPDRLDNHQQIIDEVNRQHGIAVLCHPHLYGDDYWSLEESLALMGYSGIEIYNHNEKMNQAGRAVASDLWDSLLSAGRKVWGFSSDDMHHCSRVGGGYIRVQRNSGDSLLDAIRDGHFYSSTGLDADSYDFDDGIIAIRLRNKSGARISYRVIADGIAVMAGDISSGTLLLDASTFKEKVRRYFRVEAMRDDGAYIWFQPHFRMEDRT